MIRSVDLRFPGVFFLPRQPATRPALPPLDVAAFIGFAERGPLHLPVAIKDFDMYSKVFGGDLPLAQEESGRVVYANLPRAVQAFFANGGRRCYVVRVAGDQAEAARFRLPAVVALDERSGPQLAAVSASSPGAWGSRLGLAARLAVTPFPAERCILKKGTTGNWILCFSSNDNRLSRLLVLQPGDVLRLELQDGSRWLAPLIQIEHFTGQNSEQTSLGFPLCLHFGRLYRELENLNSSPPEEVQELDLLTVSGRTPLHSRGPLETDGDRVVLRLDRTDAAQVRAGDILFLRLSGRPLGDPGFLARLVEIRGASDPGSPPLGPTFEAVFSRFLQLAKQDLPLDPFSSPPAIYPLRSVQLLRMDLLLRLDDERLPGISDLAFNAPHSRFWGDAILLESSLLNGRGTAPGSNPVHDAQKNEQAEPLRAAAAWFRHLIQDPYDFAPVKAERETLQESQAINFSPAAALTGLFAPARRSLAPDRTPGEANFIEDAAFEEPSFIYLPLGLPEVFNDADPGQFLPPETGGAGKDDLNKFDSAMFYDPRLAPPGTPGATGLGESHRTLLQAAFALYYMQGRRLRGMHSLLFIDEIAMISAPDAVQAPWQLREAETTPAPLQPFSPEREPDCPPDPIFMDCNLGPRLTAVQPYYGPRDKENPVTIVGERFTSTQPTRLYFGTRPAEGVIVESSTRLTATAPLGVRPGPVDVRLENENGSDTLSGAFIYTNDSTKPSLPMLIPPGPFEQVQDSPVVEIHQALVILCQARGDVLAMLGLPRDYNAQRCMEWQDALRRRLGLPALNEGFSYDEPTDIADLSFAAVYHPWLLNIDLQSGDRVRAVPPDGAVCGLIARRERERHIWVAPANQPLAEVLGLQTAISEHDWAHLFARRFNLVRSEAQDFRPMSAQTLSGERNLMQISVRRMLIQLRKAAVLLGMDFVFESNHEIFREGVRGSLESLLRYMFAFGAFAGRSESESFRVLTDDSVNPPESIDQGRFIAVIQVAPSEPMEFITVQLTRPGEGDLLAEEI